MRVATPPIDFSDILYLLAGSDPPAEHDGVVSLEIIYHNCFPSVKQPSGSNLLIVSNPLHPIQMLVDCIVHPEATGDQWLTRHPSQGEVGRIMGGSVEAYG